MEFHKPRFKKKSYGGSRSDRSFSSGGSRSRGSRFSRGSENSRRLETTTVTCGDCGDECQIPFRPRDNRPVYCRECFQDHKPQESGGGSRNDRGSSYGRNDRGSSYGRSRGSRFSRGSRDDRTNEMFNATCGDCGDECQIPFKPRDNRPVYCRECFKDHKPQESGRGSRFNRDSSYGSTERSSRYDQGTSRFQRDRNPIHKRDNFGSRQDAPNHEKQYRKNSFDNDSNSFYSTLRNKLFSVLGEKCVNCGFEDERALGFEQTDDVSSFDYIQRAGAASSWEKYVSDPELAKKELQVICLNCNMIKQKALD
ncbi:MAG TPA: CxxC-x17-CxxC domain-containing protein [Nitrosopumilaceae archaeon]|nr:CxxC-x17-CxxC domain-containing protein [Nitrosopumilaceae archaeon]